MALPRHPTTMENLPDEVLSAIFIRILAKQLAQMRCICKSWNALLSESSFVKSHLHRSIHNNDEILLFFRHGFSFDFSSIAARPSHSPNLELINLINCPTNPLSKERPYYGSVIGSVNGLICFSYGQCRDRLIYIWNPSLSVVLTLPPCSLPSNNMIEHHFRFGFDPKTDDNKVVKLTSLFKPPNILLQVEVYSMRKGSWELISQRFPSNIRCIIDQDEVCVDGHHGHLHWLCGTDLELKPQAIVAFDLGAETFREITLPDSTQTFRKITPPDSTLDHYMNFIGVLAGKLCVISRARDGECEVWLMYEYGVPESWVKHYQFSGYTRPYGFTSRNEFLFRHYDGISLYDPVAAKTKTFKKMNRNCKIVEYVDSLVWVVPAKRDEVLQHLSISFLERY